MPPPAAAAPPDTPPRGCGIMDAEPVGWPTRRASSGARPPRIPCPMSDRSRDLVADEALVARAVEGDEEALSRLLALLGPRIRDRLRISRRWQALVDPDDVMQTTYLEAFLRIGSLRASTLPGLQKWLERIAENNLRDAVRELERAKRPDSRPRAEQGEGEASRAAFLDALVQVSRTASRDAVTREAVDLLSDALARLPESYRQIVELYDLQGRDIDELSATLGRSKGALYMLRARAHDRLAELLGPASHLFDRRT